MAKNLKKNKKHSAMKISLIILLIFCKTVYSQDQIEIHFCDEFKSCKNSKLLQLNLVRDNDTIPFPFLGDDKFINIVNLNYDSNDNDFVPILLENCKFYYPIAIERKAFSHSFLKICIEKKTKYGKVRWRYVDYHGKNVESFTVRIKK